MTESPNETKIPTAYQARFKEKAKYETPEPPRRTPAVKTIAKVSGSALENLSDNKPWDLPGARDPTSSKKVSTRKGLKTFDTSSSDSSIDSIISAMWKSPKKQAKNRKRDIGFQAHKRRRLNNKKPRDVFKGENRLPDFSRAGKNPFIESPKDKNDFDKTR